MGSERSGVALSRIGAVLGVDRAAVQPLSTATVGAAVVAAILDPQVSGILDVDAIQILADRAGSLSQNPK
jgi:glycine/serine hydroxymethyltransferase